MMDVLNIFIASMIFINVILIAFYIYAIYINSQDDSDHYISMVSFA
jgi:hypothetical protein